MASIAYSGTAMLNETTGATGGLDTITRGATVLTDYAYSADGTVSSRILVRRPPDSELGEYIVYRGGTAAAGNLFEKVPALCEFSPPLEECD